MLFVQFGIKSTRDAWKFCQIDSPRRLVQFWKNFQTSLVLLVPNFTHNLMITYTNFNLRKFQSKYLVTLYEHVLWLLTLLKNQWRIQPDNLGAVHMSQASPANRADLIFSPLMGA